MTDVPGVILAGGRSSRMGGGDKCLLELGGIPILDRVFARLRTQAYPIAINANGNVDRFAAYGLPVLADSIEGFAGPLAGVLAGMDWAHGFGVDWIVTVAADTPFFPEDLAARLSAGARESGLPLAMAVTCPAASGRAVRHPTFGIWSVALRDDLRRSIQAGVRKVVEWTMPHGCERVEFPVGQFDPFFNVNTPDDMATAELLLQGQEA